MLMHPASDNRRASVTHFLHSKIRRGLRSTGTGTEEHIRIMPSHENKKGAILQLFEESLFELGIINHTAQYPNSRSEVWFELPMTTWSTTSILSN